MPTFTKLPERCPIDISRDKIVAWTVDEYAEEICVRIYMEGGWSFHVAECMNDIRENLPDSSWK